MGFSKGHDQIEILDKIRTIRKDIKREASQWIQKYSFSEYS
jgi:hypothetical protein